MNLIGFLNNSMASASGLTSCYSSRVTCLLHWSKITLITFCLGIKLLVCVPASATRWESNDHALLNPVPQSTWHRHWHSVDTHWVCRVGWNFGRPRRFSLVKPMALLSRFEKDKMHIVLKAWIWFQRLGLWKKYGLQFTPCGTLGQPVSFHTYVSVGRERDSHVLFLQYLLFMILLFCKINSNGKIPFGSSSLSLSLLIPDLTRCIAVSHCSDLKKIYFKGRAKAMDYKRASNCTVPQWE